MKKAFSFLGKPPFSSFEKQIVSVFKQAPELSRYFIDGLVLYGPIIVLALGILGLLSVLLSLRVIMFIGVVYLAGSLVSSLLLLFSYNYLKAKRLLGWQMVFWSANVSVLTSLIHMRVVIGVFSALISWYFLTQMRNRYS